MKGPQTWASMTEEQQKRVVEMTDRLNAFDRDMQSVCDADLLRFTALAIHRLARARRRVDLVTEELARRGLSLAGALPLMDGESLPT